MTADGDIRIDTVHRVRRELIARGYRETITPILQESPGADAEIASFQTRYEPLMEPGSARELHLHTSPEFAMKRLLCRSAGPIFQICPCFRQGELGPLHSPEFLMAEWYRPGLAWTALMDEVEDLIAAVLGQTVRIAGKTVELKRPFRRMTLEEAFAECGAAADWRSAPDEAAARDLLYRAWVDRLDPWFADQGAVFIAGFPPPLATLSAIGPDGLAERFELTIAGIELANGCAELTDPAEHRRRFQTDREIRRAAGKPVPPLPEAFLQDLATLGLPPCSGVAVGIDRLAMIRAGSVRLSDILPLPF